MVRRPARGLLVLLLAAVAFLAWHGRDLALVGVKDVKSADAEEEEKSGPLPLVVGEVAKVARFWEQPHNIRFSHGNVGLRSVSQGKDQWQLSVSENGDANKPGVFLSQAGKNEGLTYGFEYDSTQTPYSVANATGLKLKRVAASAVARDGLEDMDWTLHIEGDQARRFSATGNGDSVVYEGTFGLEAPVKEGLTLRYGLNAKRRHDAEGVLPSWYRHGLGLRYASSVGNATVQMQQPDPDLEDGMFEYAASLQGKIDRADIKGSPTYTLGVTRNGRGSTAYNAQLRLKGPEGLTGGVLAALRDGTPALSAVGEYAAKRSVADGVEVGGDAKMSITPHGLRHGLGVEIQPIGLRASADLSKLAPGLMDSGSTVDLRARYKLGAGRPAVSAAARLKASKLSDVELAAEASVDDRGLSSGRLRLTGSARGVNAKYEAVASPGKRARHAAEVLWPVELKSVSARAFGRVFQSAVENGGRPRVQLGVQYDFNTDVAGRSVRMDGDSAIYDSGSTLLGDSGVAARFIRARLGARTLRNRIEGTNAESQNKVHHDHQ